MREGEASHLLRAQRRSRRRRRRMRRRRRNRMVRRILPQRKSRLYVFNYYSNNTKQRTIVNLTKKLKMACMSFTSFLFFTCSVSSLIHISYLSFQHLVPQSMFQSNLVASLESIFPGSRIFTLLFLSSLLLQPFLFSNNRHFSEHKKTYIT